MKKARKSKSKKRILFDKVWKVFSKYVRMRDKGVCFTCGQPGNMAGHFVHGKHKPTYFRDDNVHCQCPKCNFFLNGNRDVYLRKIQLKYGIERGDELLGLKTKTKNWTIPELETLLKIYE